MDVQISTLTYMINDKNVKIYRDEENRIIVDGDITIYNDEFDMFPVKIYKVNGNISWCGNVDGFKPGSLRTLTNFPDIVTGNVYIYKNPNLSSLYNCPKEIGGSLVCDHCDISNINGIAKNIKKHFIASNNPISDIKILEKVFIGGNIELINTNWKGPSNSIKLLNDSSIIVVSQHVGIFD